MSTHTFMLLAGLFISIVGIGGAAYYHWLKREAADEMAQRWAGVVNVLANKYYVDELYHAVIVKPLHLIGEICYVFDRLVIDALVAFVGFVPKWLGLKARLAQRGALQGYGLGMAVGAAVIALLLMFITFRT